MRRGRAVVRGDSDAVGYFRQPAVRHSGVDEVRALAADDHVHVALADPRGNVEPDVKVGLLVGEDAGHDRNLATLLCADGVHQVSDFLDEAVHCRDAGFGLFHAEVEREEHEIELDAVGAVIDEHLANHCLLVFPNHVVREVVGPFGLMLGPTRVVDAVADGGLVPPSEPAASVGAGRLSVLQAEAGEYGQARSPSVLDDLSDLVGALLAGYLHHPHDAPVDVAFPDLFGLPDDAPDLAVVEVDVAVSESEHEEVDARAEHLVDGLSELVER